MSLGVVIPRCQLSESNLSFSGVSFQGAKLSYVKMSFLFTFLGRVLHMSKGLGLWLALAFDIFIYKSCEPAIAQIRSNIRLDTNSNRRCCRVLIFNLVHGGLALCYTTWLISTILSCLTMYLYAMFDVLYAMNFKECLSCLLRTGLKPILKQNVLFHPKLICV